MIDNKDVYDLFLFFCGFCMSVRIIKYSYWKGRGSHDCYTCWLMVKASSQMLACQKLQWLWFVWFLKKLFLNLLPFTKDFKFLGLLIQLYLPILVLFYGGKIYRSSWPEQAYWWSVKPYIQTGKDVILIVTE